MIIISPYAKRLRNGKDNPKNYPYWEEVVSLIGNKEHIVQIGIDGEKQLVDDFRKNLSLEQLAELVGECRTWVSIDSFFQHFCWNLGIPGVVLFGQSDPNIFGHPENINLLKDRSYLYPNQFLIWEQIPHRNDCFVDPKVVADYLLI